MFKFDKIRRDRLKNNMKRQDLSRALLREGVVISFRTILNWETGKTTPNAIHIEKLAYIFNKPVTSYFTTGRNNGRIRTSQTDISGT